VWRLFFFAFPGGEKWLYWYVLDVMVVVDGGGNYSVLKE
jgi:hypothetical protein